MTTNGDAAAPYDWLAMIFLGGDNDLFRFGQNLIEEAKRVGSSDRVAIFAQHDPTRPLLPTRRGQVLPGRWLDESIGPTAGGAKTIIDFVRHAKVNFPAQNRMLTLWDHGNGWQNVHVFDAVTDATDRLKIENVFEVVNQQPDIAVLCFDACLMAMIEIAYELRDRVKYIVASENVVPADRGWPHDAILRTLTMRPRITPGQVACAILDSFAGSYTGSEQPVTLSALKLDKVEAAVTEIDLLARELIAACTNGGRREVLFARRYSQSFGNPDYIDIISFCEQLRLQFAPETDIAQSAAKVKQAVGDMVLGATRSSAQSVRGSHGVSIYFPDRPMSPLYYKLEFAKTKTCMWATFIAMLAPNIMPPRRMASPRPGTGHESLQAGQG